mmetsp:Transcript_37068/g.56860  ORF Transcript_37068/g.56860 Transcript_37068/m.56860 type:complete len:127 (+) Transcript_37068:3219-3599(+)
MLVSLDVLQLVLQTLEVLFGWISAFHLLVRKPLRHNLLRHLGGRGRHSQLAAFPDVHTASRWTEVLPSLAEPLLLIPRIEAMMEANSRAAVTTAWAVLAFKAGLLPAHLHKLRMATSMGIDETVFL